MDFDLILLTCTFGWGEALAEKYPVNRNIIVQLLRLDSYSESFLTEVSER